MTLEHPFPIYGKVTNGLGLPITDRAVMIRVYDTRPGHGHKEVSCDDNGYYQINIQDMVEEYGMTVHIMAWYPNTYPSIIERSYYFEVNESDMSKEVNFRISEQYYMTDSTNLSIEVT